MFSYKSPSQPFFSWCCFGISDIASANCVCMFALVKFLPFLGILRTSDVITLIQFVYVLLLYTLFSHECIIMQFLHAKFHIFFPRDGVISLPHPPQPLKEKRPQAFMQIGWMEDDFRNLTANVWANLDNPIKRYDFSKVLLILCMSPSQVALF